MSALMQRAVPVLLLAMALVPLYYKYTALSEPSDSRTWVSTKAPANASAAAEQEEMSGWMAFMTQSPHLFLLSLWSSSIIVRALFIVSLLINARRLFNATALPRGPSLTHWAGAVLAHRGYRSEAQQNGQIVSAVSSRTGTPRTSRRSSRAGLPSAGAPTPPVISSSRRSSRDETAINPIVAAAAATLFEKTFGAPVSPAPSPTAASGAPAAPFSQSDSNLLASRRRSSSGAGLSSGLPPLAPSPSTATATFGLSPRPPSAPMDANNYNIPENR